MTLAELTRAFDSKRRVERLRLQEKALFDYKLADLIGRSFARTQHSANKLPEITEFYPELFEEGAVAEEIQQKKEQTQAELFALQLRQYSERHNEKLIKEAENN
jgi:hypothetical protein